MSLQAMKIFLAVVDCGGVTRAAERLRLSQPAVSASLKGLEQELGCVLLERRDGRRVQPTAQGALFADRARLLLADYQAACDAITGAAGMRTVRLGVLQTIARDRVVNAYRTFVRTRPNWRLEIWEDGAERLDRRLARHRLDALWTIGEEGLSDNPLVAVFAPNSEVAPLSLADLADFPFVFRAECELSADGERRLTQAGVRLSVVARVQDDALAFQLVEAGMGITLAPSDLVPPTLRAVTVDGLAVGRQLVLRARAGLDNETFQQLVDCCK